MTSKQVMLTTAMMFSCGCALISPRQPALFGPYEQRMVWAAAPLSNESGSQHADGLRLADQLASQLEQAANIDVLPVNRTIEAMHSLQIEQVTTPQEAAALRQVLGADALVVGVISAYDPYDPPKIGLAVELHLDPRYLEDDVAFDVRRQSRSPQDELTLPSGDSMRQPVSTVSAYLDSADPAVRKMLQRYANKRSGIDSDKFAWVRYRSSMDLYSEFASYVMSWRLLQAETDRVMQLAQQPQTAP